MKSILVVDDMAVIREPIAAALRNAGYEAKCAASGAEALAMVRDHVPDLIVLDLSMPKIGGIVVLRSLRSSKPTSTTPVILLTASAEKQIIMEAAKWGVRDYLLKSRFSLDELLGRVKRHLTDAKGKMAGITGPTGATFPTNTAKPMIKLDPNAIPEKLLARDDALARAESALDMKALPGVVMDVISQAASPRADSASLAALISRDSMLAAKILQAANSPAYASNRGMVATLPEAVRNIGCATVRNVAASLSIIDAMPASTDGSFNLLRCWQHSLAVAVLCERLASMSNICPPNVAYLVGLCHDLGEILFRTTFAAEYEKVIDFQTKTGLRRETIERDMLGITHNELVGVILKKIGLPESIRGPINAMRLPKQDKKDPVATLLSLANVYANGLTLCESLNSRILPISKADCRLATGVDNPAVPDPTGFRGEIISMTAVLARLSSAQEKELTTPLIAPTEARIWLVLDRTLSSFDPITALLSSCGHLNISERLPDKTEAADLDRIVVAASSTKVAGMNFSDIQPLQDYIDPESILWLVGNLDGVVASSDAIQPQQYPASLQIFKDFLTSTATVAAAP